LFDACGALSRANAAPPAARIVIARSLKFIVFLLSGRLAERERKTYNTRRNYFG
jgi:hypothetical protein